ncbi:MAG: metalloregulator ArsR/SmtB family transcription factor [Variovorax sp.]
MVEISEDRLDAVFHALSDSTRRTMLRLLAQGECSIGELAAPFPMSFAGASKHVKSLEQAGLVSRSVQGRNHVCRLEADALGDAEDWLRFYEHFWSTRLEKDASRRPT